MSAILSVENLSVRFKLKQRKGFLRALRGVSFSLTAGETLGVVGESGSGKSTLARAILRLIEAHEGRVVFDGDDLGTLGERDLRWRRRDMQLIFQDPLASLDPRWRVGDLLSEPFEIHRLGDKKERALWVRELLTQVGLDAEAAHRFPHEFSGGQRQRIAIARALALKPRLVVADEPVSALDVSIQAQILNLLLDLKAALGLTYIFISHDLAVVRQVSERVAVMYLGEIVEQAPAERFFAEPRHPYSRALLESVPNPGRERPHQPLTGDQPNPEAPPRGCAFHTRCPVVMARCAMEKPPTVAVGEPGQTHLANCWLLTPS